MYTTFAPALKQKFLLIYRFLKIVNKRFKKHLPELYKGYILAIRKIKSILKSCKKKKREIFFSKSLPDKK